MRRRWCHHCPDRDGTGRAEGGDRGDLANGRAPADMPVGIVQVLILEADEIVVVGVGALAAGLLPPI
jgi:hypothetical protein